jgi:uncharacterized membrane protein
MMRSLTPTITNHNGRRLIIAGIVTGVGFGGFFDGIVFHQILQWHHMVSAMYPATNLPNLELNTLWDGLFHTFTYVVLIIGFVLLWRASRRANFQGWDRSLLGAVFVGSGLFNLVEGLINHYLLQIHHVKHGADQTLWDLAFLASGALLVIIGMALIRANSNPDAPPIENVQY